MLHCTIMCNILRKSLTYREKPMFDFTKQTKQFEELAERIKEVNEFWIKATFTTIKDLFKVK